MNASYLQTLFNRSVELIEQEYIRLGHTLGWRFFMGPRATLSPETRIGLISLNPGGDSNPPDHPSSSRESGSAYYEETWGMHRPGLAPLQRQIQGMCALIQHHTNDQSALEQFMARNVLAACFVPFRSPGWSALPRRHESVEFSRQLWADILGAWMPRLLVTIDRETYNFVATLLSRNGTPFIEHREWPSGWGGYVCESNRYAGPLTLARLPHLSRFGLFNRPASAPQMNALVSYLCEGFSAPALQRM